MKDKLLALRDKWNEIKAPSYGELWPLIKEIESHVSIHENELDTRRIAPQIKIVIRELQQFQVEGLGGSKEGTATVNRLHDNFEQDFHLFLSYDNDIR